MSANRTKPPANAELCLLYIVQRFTLKRAIIWPSHIILQIEEARKDNIEATYMQNDNALVEQLNAIEQGKANAISGAVQGVTNAVSQMPF